MEIRLMDKNPETGRFVNVEVYSQIEFEGLVQDCVRSALKKVGFFNRLTRNFTKAICDSSDSMIRVFKQRLKEDRN